MKQTKNSDIIDVFYFVAAIYSFLWIMWFLSWFDFWAKNEFFKIPEKGYIISFWNFIMKFKILNYLGFLSLIIYFLNEKYKED
jgi:hypothetical protein